MLDKLVDSFGINFRSIFAQNRYDFTRDVLDGTPMFLRLALPPSYTSSVLYFLRLILPPSYISSVLYFLRIGFDIITHKIFHVRGVDFVAVPPFKAG